MFAERNQRAHRLVSALADAAGPRVQRESAVDAQSAKGLAVWHLKRVLAVQWLAGHGAGDMELAVVSSQAHQQLQTHVAGLRLGACLARTLAACPAALLVLETGAVSAGSGA